MVIYTLRSSATHIYDNFLQHKFHKRDYHSYFT